MNVRRLLMRGLGIGTLLPVMSCLMVLHAAPIFAADDNPSANDTTKAAPADQPAMAGCPGKDGACCGACQEKAAENKPAEQAAGGCPCQRAKQSQQKGS
ncbi:MAG TPA: hypothetical protein VMW17_10105 [Candidatus Binatia bacterium]|nr:hypothetical protein [Candidatus Binatia bacterium]